VLPRFARDEGTVTAELAIVTPAIIAVLALALGAIGYAAQHVADTSVANSAARQLARGVPLGEVMAQVTHAHPGITLTSEVAGDQVCVRLTSETRVAGLSLPAETHSCAVAR
jgi:hypothetical protein